MKIITAGIISLTILLAGLNLGMTQGTAFTYQGRLNDGTNPANGLYDLQFGVYNASSGGTLQGSMLTIPATGVTNGLFTVTLDFGGQFPGAPRWLDIAVRTNGSGSLTSLSPRQAFTATPYAITAGNVSGTISSANLAGSYGSAVTFNNPADNFTGSFSGNGANVTNVNAATLGGQSAGNFWQLGGNGVAAGQFLGSTNNQALELDANGVRALRLEPNTNGAPNVIGGGPYNLVFPGTVGAFIGGGGASNYNTGTLVVGYTQSNSVGADFGTIAGGDANSVQAGATYSAISGGFANQIQPSATASWIGGGNQNVIQGSQVGVVLAGGDQNNIGSQSSFSTIGGGGVNLIGASSPDSVIGGGEYDNIAANADHNAIVGGKGNSIDVSSPYNFIGGGQGNFVTATNAVIAGGISNRVLHAHCGTISGGQANMMGDVNALADYSTIAGGLSNTNQGFLSTIGGGQGNVILSALPYGTADGVIGGGFLNSIGKTNRFFTAGGTLNGYETIAGGGGNFIGTNASNATIGGGLNNYILGNGTDATIPGGDSNTATNYAFAAGHRAKAIHTGANVWADSQDADFSSTGTNQYLIRASGNVGINTNNPTYTLTVNGDVAASSLRSPGAGVGTGTFAFIQRTVATNTSANYTIIYNPLTDNDPNAILVITHNYSADTNAVPYNTEPVGVWYFSPHWTIYNENGSSHPMALGRAFNVLVIKP